MKREEFPAHVQRAIEKAEARAQSKWSNVKMTNCTLQGSLAEPIAVAKGRVAKKRGMNRLEEAYGEHLLAERAAGEYKWYRYEGVTLKLADDTRFTPDFFVLDRENNLLCMEVKGGFRREDSFVKLKVAAGMYPFRFFLVTRKEDGEWEHREIHA